MATRRSLIPHGEIQKMLSNQHRPWPHGVPEAAKGPKESSESQKVAGQAGKRSKLTPKDQNQGIYSSGARQRYANSSDEEGYS